MAAWRGHSPCPRHADAEHSKAAFSEGLLTLSLPKMTVKPTHSRDIDIR